MEMPVNLEDCDSLDRLPRHTVKQTYILILLDAMQPLQTSVYLFYRRLSKNIGRTISWHYQMNKKSAWSE